MSEYNKLKTPAFNLYLKIKETLFDFHNECVESGIPIDDLIVLSALRIALMDCEETLRFRVKSSFNLFPSSAYDEKEAEAKVINLMQNVMEKTGLGASFDKTFME